MTEGFETLRLAKQTLREHMKAVRASVPPVQRARAATRIAERVRELVADCPVVMAFLSFGTEVPTDDLIVALHDAGHRIAVPHVAGEEIVPLAYRPGDPVDEAVFGIREPAEHEPVAHEDVGAVIVPGLAFDREGYRLGYGGGFYDRILRLISPDALTAGVCFGVQMVPQVPRGEQDVPVAFVVTEDELITCRREA